MRQLVDRLALSLSFRGRAANHQGGPAHAAELSRVDEEEARSALEKLGGRAQPLARDKPHQWQVDFHLRGRDLTDAGLAHVAALPNVVSLNLRGTKITSAGIKKNTRLTV